MMDELKPCPFCGGVAQVNTWTMHGITESRCFCSNSDCPNSVRTVALEQWNTRPIEDALHARIAELEEERRWIPVSERLPELFTIVLVCDCDGGMETDWIWNNKDGISRFMNSFKTVTHWMSLPQPPEVQE